MEENYANVEPKPSTNHTGPTSSEESSYLGVTIFLGLLSIFLLLGLVTLVVFYGHSAAELSDIKGNMTVFLQTSKDKLSSMTEERDLLKANLIKMTEERDLLNANLTEMTEERDLLNISLTKITKEMERLQNLPKQILPRKTCPEGWKMFSCTCHFLSEASGSWDEGRQDCRNRGADLVVIDSPEEQTSISGFIKKDTWIGLNDTEKEGTWKWIDGTPMTLNYWGPNQPDNGGASGRWGEEDCAHISAGGNFPWNDASCSKSLPWMCEKIP
ncbi:CD209 antigen-like protein C [Mugil cephalus]|uniref:CD209 antigen-like protein C n=1 Tax=Mugil cephalus TaxID=48193 RepID=UPI001FB7A1DF|nr:CD209 antigen-like protein C [Mugil cephalus]